MIDITFDGDGRIVSEDGIRAVGSFLKGYLLYSRAVINNWNDAGESYDGFGYWQFRGHAASFADAYTWLKDGKANIGKDLQMNGVGDIVGNGTEVIEA